MMDAITAAQVDVSVVKAELSNARNALAAEVGVRPQTIAMSMHATEIGWRVRIRCRGITVIRCFPRKMEALQEACYCIARYLKTSPYWKKVSDAVQAFAA